MKVAKHTYNDLKELVEYPETLAEISKEYTELYIFNENIILDDLKKETDPIKISGLQARLKRCRDEKESWRLENLMKTNQEHLDRVKKFLDGFSNDCIGNAERFFNVWENVPQSVIENVTIGGLYIIKDNKIYREDNFGIKLKVDPIGDGDFRIYDYAAKPCYTAQDCFDRCKEYNVVLDKEQKEHILKWFEAYPDTIVEFG